VPGRFAAPHRRAARVRVGERAAACECVSCTGAQVVGLHIRIGMGTCSCKCDATTNWLFLNPRKGLWQGLFRQCARGSPAILMARPALGCLCSCGLHVKCSPKTFGFASVDCIRVASGHGGSVWSAEYCQLLIASVLAAWHIWPGPRRIAWSVLIGAQAAPECCTGRGSACGPWRCCRRQSTVSHHGALLGKNWRTWSMSMLVLISGQGV